MDHLLDDGFARDLAGATVRATVLLLVAWGATRALRRSSSAVLHRVWTLALLGLIVLPIAMRIVPVWRVPILPETRRSAEPTPPPAASRPIQETAAPVVAAGEAPSVATVLPSSRPTAAPGAPASVSTPPAARSAPSPALVPRPSAVFAAPWAASDLVLAAWALGLVAALLPTLAGLVVGEVRRRRSGRVDDDGWPAQLDSVRELYAIHRPVKLRRGGDSSIPLTWGVVRPVVLIPEESGGWPEATRRLVLLHELAHIRRLDVTWLMLGRAAAACFWFHPLAWYALRRVRDESERACDDCVVAAGERPTDYARELLDLARSLRMPRFAVAVAMARHNPLEGRMMAMFDTRRSHAPLGRGSGRLLVALAALVTVVIASVRPGPSTARAEAPPPTTAPQAPGRISGVALRDSDGTPIAMAEVSLLPPPPPPKGDRVYIGKLRKVVADANGAFAFEGLAPGKHLVWANSGPLTSRLKDFHRGGEAIVVPESGEGPKPVELRLVAAPTITARFKDKATGKPIAGATVHLVWSDFPDDFNADAQGVALVRPLTPERYLLEVRADGYAMASRWVNLENGADAEESFALEPGGNLEGVVRDAEGKPLAGVGLSARLEGRFIQYQYVTTKGDGSYRLAHLPRGVAVTISASKGDFSGKEVAARLDGPAGKLDFSLERRPDGGSIVGVVRDLQGRPIAGAELKNEGRSTDQNRETKTGADGRFRFDNLFEGSAGKDVIVRAKGFAPERVKFEPGPREKPAEVAIDLEVGHKIKGRVVDDKGRPIAGVMVDFADGRNAFTDGGRMNTDAEGRFAFDSLPTDSPFGFSKEGFSDIQGRRLELDGDGEVVVAMTSASVILGKVVDAKTGKPIENFVVQITFSPKRRQGDPSAGLRSDLSNPGQSFQSAEGLFKLNDLVVKMPLQVTVLAEGYEKQVAERVEAAHPAEPRVEEFRLEPIDPATLRTLSGRMVDADGKPVAGAQLRLIVAGPRDPGPRHGFPFNWTMVTTGQIAQVGRVSRFLEASTDARGLFAFERVPRGFEIELVWWGEGVVPGRADHLEDVERKEGERIEVVTPAPARLIGAIDRKRHPEAGRIRAADQIGAIEYNDLELKPGQDDYEFRHLAPGTYTVTLSSGYERVPGSSRRITSRTLASGKATIEPGGTARVDFQD